MKPWRELADKYRTIPLEQVIVQAGGAQDIHDRQKWQTPNGPVWVGKDRYSQKFFDHTNGTGGGGAIDLVQHIFQVDFKDAIKWLHNNFGNGSYSKYPRSMLTKHPYPDTSNFQAPKPILEYRADILIYLTKERAIPASIINGLLDQGSIFADSKHNAVFLCEFNGEITGAEIRGTTSQSFKGMATGSHRGVGFFTLTHPKPTQLVIVESAIDALSYRALNPQESTLIISTAGVMPFCPKLIELAKLRSISEIVIAYDNDSAGDINAEKLANSMIHSGLIVRRKSPQLKDWNDVLRHTTGSLFNECA
jgi:hypothetical protein